MIKIKELSVKFGKETILQNINLDIGNNEYLLIVGKSGVGKSILIKTILHLNKDFTGNIVIDEDDKNINKISSLVFQNSALLDSMTVFQNVALPLFENGKHNKREIESSVNNILKKLGIEEISEKYPYQLSGGMQKRVAIARAVITNPKYIFYDEPTTGLDPTNAGRVMKLINEIHNEKNITTIIVTHDKRILHQPNARIILIYDKKIIFDGNYSELINANDKRISEYLNKEKNVL